ncbi:MAG: hypothetical protein IH914_07805 [candidate division Zixibacteria bacterium]|nr:hypothetical protein [candidate division Zixibacteria bacterium]
MSRIITSKRLAIDQRPLALIGMMLLFALSACDSDNSTGPGSGQTQRTGWYRQSPLPTGEFLFGVSFSDANTGTAVGTGGAILRTTDGGANWVSQTSGTTEWLRGVSFSDANAGTAVGLAGTILRTTDGGANWVSQTSGTSQNLLGVSFSDANTGTAVGDLGTILRTTDGGGI